jgi:hypothetical protein
MKSVDDFIEISQDLVDNKLQYAYPYQLKEFLIKYSKNVIKFISSKENTKLT